MASAEGPTQEYEAVMDEKGNLTLLPVRTTNMDGAEKGSIVKVVIKRGKGQGSAGGGVDVEGEKGQLDSQLLNLLNIAKTGDARTLQKMTTAVKKYLYESNEKKTERRRSVYLLLEHEGFVPPLLMKCLKSNVGKVPGLVGDSLWILNSILELGDCSITKQIDAIVEAGAVPLMVKLVGVQDNHFNLNAQALGVLENLACRGYRDQLVAGGSSLISSMIKIAKKKNCSAALQKKMVHIVSAVLGQVRINSVKNAISASTLSRRQKQKEKLAGYQEIIDSLPPLSMVKELIPLLSLLINTKDAEVLGKVLSCLAFGGCVKGSFQPIVDSGILKKVAPHFSHSDEVVRFFAITSISSIASVSDENALIFLKSMKGTFALKEFHLGLSCDNDALVWAADQFFSAAVNAITGDADISSLNAVLSSGFVHALVQCLKPEMREKHVLGSAWAIGRISTEVPLAQRRVVVEAGALPFLVEQLKNSNEIVSSMAAVSIGNLVQEKPLNRDQVVALGAIPLLVDLIKNTEGSSLQALISILASLEMIADVKPAAPAEIMKDLPIALISVLDNKTIKFPDKLIPGIYSIISKLCEAGSAGVDIVIESGFLPRLKGSLSSGNVDTLAFAVESVESISRGTKEQRDAMMEIGMVEALIGLLNHNTKYIRRVALCALSNLYKGQLTPEKRLVIQKMVPQVIVEISKQDPRTNHPAGLAFQNVFNHFKLN